MPLTQTLEIIMMGCFGISWPFSIVRSLRARSAKGKSLIFLLLIDFGYLCGIVWKIIEWYQTKTFTYPVIAYLINFCLVTVDLMLYFKNRGLDKAAKEAEKAKNNA